MARGLMTLYYVLVIGVVPGEVSRAALRQKVAVGLENE